MRPLSRCQREPQVALGVLQQMVQARAANLTLTDQEAAAFWPIYRRYQYERSKLDDARVDVIKEYTEKYPDLTDDEMQRVATLYADHFGMKNEDPPKFKGTMELAESR